MNLQDNLIKKDPLVSIIIPSYNRSYCIKRCIDSVLDQSYKNLECIVIDNYSTDNSNDIFFKYKDKRLKILKINNRGIIAKSRNMGILNSKGEIIAFLDSDDWWFKNKLKICIDEIQKGYDFIYHDLIIRDFSSKKSFINKRYISARKICGNSFDYLLKKGNPIPLSSSVIKKRNIKIAGYFDEDIKLVGAEDYYLWLNLSIKKCKFKNLNVPLGYYSINNDALTSSEKSEVYFSKIFKKLYDRKLSKSNRIMPWANLSLSFLFYKERKYKTSLLYSYKSFLTLNYKIFFKSLILIIFNFINLILKR